MSNETELLRQCAASGQMDSRQVAAHVEAGEMEAEKGVNVRRTLFLGHSLTAGFAAALLASPAVAESAAPGRTKAQPLQIGGEWAAKPAHKTKKGRPTKAEKKAAKRARIRAATPLPTYHQQEKP